MPTREEVKEIIKTTVVRSITSYAERKIEERKFQILDLLIPMERKTRSVVGGLETSMGRTLWEPLARTLAANNGFVVNNSIIQKPGTMPNSLGNIIQNVYESRLNNTNVYNSESGKRAIVETCQEFIRDPIPRFVKPARGHGVDVWLTKGGVNYLFDTKTVQPNIANLRGYLDQLLHWYGYYYSQFPTGNVEARIVFPYNPYDGDFWEQPLMAACH